MRGRCITMIVLMLSMGSSAHAHAPLAIGGAPPCSKQNGTREFHSAVVEDGSVSASIVGIAHRDAAGCQRSAEIRIENADGGKKSFPLPADADDFEIVDFSPDGSKLFIADEGGEVVHIANMPIATGELQWRDISDLLGWKDCEATVEPRGFTADGKLAVQARPSVLSSSPRPNCVADAKVYAFDENWKASVIDTDAAATPRFGKKTHPATQACQSDPDLTDACFTLRGRLSASNGNPTFRIWRIGTTRMLGLTDRLFPSDEIVLPESLDGKLVDDVDAYGDFLVCPFTSDAPGTMQMVCLESAENVTFKASTDRR
jgi:hypothetical protein